MEDFLEHKSVLFTEIKNIFDFQKQKARVIDGTLGNGGHSKGLLENCPNLEILGIDRDSEAIVRATKNLEFAKNRVKIYKGTFSQMAEFANEERWRSVDGILLDIGVSSPQLDDEKRGFSWRMSGPLDMRMDRTSPLTASRILNSYSEKDLSDIFFFYGEIKQSRKLARMVVQAREEKPLETTEDFVKICDAALGKARDKKLPTPTLPFQAIRIAVNDELNELKTTLESAFSLLKVGGILAVISFHSLEDRIVKQFMKHLAQGCRCPANFPVCVCNHKPELEIINNKVITASNSEIRDNKRSACAKLRVAKRLV